MPKDSTDANPSDFGVICGARWIELSVLCLQGFGESSRVFDKLIDSLLDDLVGEMASFE